MRWLLLTVLAGCGGKEPDSAPGPVDAPTSVGAFTAAAVEAGWTVGEGSFVSSTMAYCCEALVACLDVDPSAPYGAIALPPAPDQIEVDRDRYWMWGDGPASGTARDFKLRPDEAVVWIGTAPPRADHFGMGTMLSTREDGYGARHWVLGALGPAVTQVTVAAERGVEADAVWDRPLVVVTTADQATEREVLRWLVDAGFERDRLHSDRIPTDVVRMGLDAGADSFATLLQVLDAEDSEALAAWWASEPVVLRLSPPARATDEPHPVPTLPAPPAEDEAAWVQAVLDLERAIRDTWSPAVGIAGEMSWDGDLGYSCLDDLHCGGDTAERLRARSGDLTLEEPNFAVAFGVNHVRTGRSTTSTVAVHRKLTGTALNWTDDEALVGTARAYLGDNHPLADDLYALIVARDCDDWVAPCLEVPMTCPSVPEGERMYLLFSDHVDPATGVGPTASALIPPRVLKFFTGGAL